MEIKIKDIDKNPVWALPEVKIFLSAEQNDFVRVDYQNMPKQTQSIIWSAIKRDVLESKDGEDFLKSFEKLLQEARLTAVQKQAPVLPKPQEVVSIKEQVISSPKDVVAVIERAENLKEIISMTVPSLKKKLPELNFSDLSLILKLEKNGKKRKVVLDLIGKLISTKRDNEVENQVKKVMNNLEDSTSDSIEFIDVLPPKQKKLLSNVQDVVDSDKEEITVELYDPQG